VSCDALFGDEPERVIPLVGEDGMILLSHDGCSCDGQTCSFQLLSSAPPLKTDASANAAVMLGGDSMATCDPTVVCPNMDSCTSVSYGGAGCGWDCERAGGQYWCSDHCSCNTIEASECAPGPVCPGMHSCSPISYGEYGCGYGCMRHSTYFFCSADCSNCNE
jgi:hypothetical protein